MTPQERAIARVVDRLAARFEHCGCFTPWVRPRPVRGAALVFYAAEGRAYGDFATAAEVLLAWSDADRLARYVVDNIAGQLARARSAARLSTVDATCPPVIGGYPQGAGRKLGRSRAYR